MVIPVRLVLLEQRGKRRSTKPKDHTCQKANQQKHRHPGAKELADLVFHGVRDVI